MNLFESTSVSWWSGEKAVACNGTSVARLRFGNWKIVGVITIGENDYEVSKASIFSSVLSLRSGGALLCQTWIEGFWNQTANFVFDGVAYRLKWSGWRSRVVLEREGKEIGVVDGSRASFPEEVSPLVAVFALWMVAYKRKRDSSAAAAAG